MKRSGPRRVRNRTPSRCASSNSSCPWVVRSTGISSKFSRETTVTSRAPALTANRAESNASFTRASDSAASSSRSCAASVDVVAERGARRVEGDEAAADDDHALAELAHGTRG